MSPDKSSMPARSKQSEVDTNNVIWYLGIDFGTTSLSAVLLNQSTGQRYPIYWLEEEARENKAGGAGGAGGGVFTNISPKNSSSDSSASPSPSRPGEVIFRLPTVTYSGLAASKRFVDVPGAPLPIVVGSLASNLAKKQHGIVLENFKPFLNIALPYYSSKRQEWEPSLELPSQQYVSLYWVRRALQALLATLIPKKALSNPVIRVGAVGLEPKTLEHALGQLEGVVLGTPVGWGDTYCFNLREAVLQAKLVKYPEQVFFLEDAIASILASLPTTNVDAPKSEKLEEQENFTPSPHLPWQGGTLAINAGAIATELVLVDLPDNLQDLTYSDFHLCSFPYGGNAIDQDIFCQLLYPQLSEAQRQEIFLDCDVELPLPGQPDSEKRDRLVLLLQRNPLGQALLKASGYLKLILQHKDEFTLNLGNDRWSVKRLDLETQVFLPFVQQLNHELNALLIKTGLSEHGISQVICTGGTAALGTLKTWLQHKISNATPSQETDLPTGTWVAAGLASLPLYPQALNRTQQQYSDYFLLSELLSAFPETIGNLVERTYTIKEIMQQLEHRGLNTSACYERLVCLIEGQLPSGLVPRVDDTSWLSAASKQNPLYSAIATAELFERKSPSLFRLNPQQQKRLCHYLSLVLSGTHQTFKEPIVVKL